MTIETLETSGALTSGAEIWIVADLARSQWTRKIDWYLNFQLMRAGSRRAPELSPGLLRVMDTWDIPEVEVSIEPASPLLVASASLLPNGKTILIPFRSDSESAKSDGGGGDWVRHCHQIWSALARPSLRVFLPDEMGVDEFKRHWPTAAQETQAQEAQGQAAPRMEVVSVSERTL